MSKVSLGEILSLFEKAEYGASAEEIRRTVDELLAAEKRLRELATYLQTRNQNIACGYLANELSPGVREDFLAALEGVAYSYIPLGDVIWALATAGEARLAPYFERELDELRTLRAKLEGLIGVWRAAANSIRYDGCLAFCADGVCKVDPTEVGFFEKLASETWETVSRVKEIASRIKKTIEERGVEFVRQGIRAEEVEGVRLRLGWLISDCDALLSKLNIFSSVYNAVKDEIRKAASKCRRSWVPVSPLGPQEIRGALKSIDESLGAWVSSVLYSELGWNVTAAIRTLLTALVFRMFQAGRSDGLEVLAHNASNLFDEVRTCLDDLSREFGRRVGFIVPYADSHKDVSPAGYLNDLANALHVTAEELSKRMPATELEEVGFCRLPRGAPEWQKRFCEIWSKAYEERRDDYFVNDIGSLLGYSTDANRLYLRLGNSPGHATYIERKPNGYYIRYYDTDSSVNKCIADLLRELAGCQCNVVSGFEAFVRKEEGVECSCPPDSIERIALILARATSMDIRYEDWGWTCEDEFKVVRELARKLGVSLPS